MEQIPLILRPWISLYRATPKLLMPGTDVDLAFPLLFTVLLSALRLCFRHALYYHGWPVDALDTYFASSCFVSMCHSMMILPGLAAILLSQEFVPSGKLQPSPRWYQDATNSLMGFCTGYMLCDSIMMSVEKWQPGIGVVYSDDDWLYLGHHILTILYMTSARWKNAGHMSAMVLMFNGEFSAPVMNFHLFLEKALTQEQYEGVAWLSDLFAFNERCFSYLYLICRVAVSPFVISYVSYELLFTKRGRQNVPLWLSLCWMPMCWGVQFGSIPWIRTCIETVGLGSAPKLGHGEF